MYNLDVAVAHTFYVGDGQWLVHNAGSKTFRHLLTPEEIKRFEELKAKYPEWMPNLDDPASVRSKDELAQARSSVKGR